MRTIDLFCGCGGMSLGFQDSGFNILGAYDNWQKAVQCYSQNFEHPIYNVDLSKPQSIARSLQKENVEIIIGGPPCQDFSQAGKRVEGEKANLTQSFAEIISLVGPNWYVMENVERVYKSESYQSAKRILKSSGYGITEVVLDASLCGVPQKRKRFFSIGKLHEQDEFLAKQIEMAQADKPLTLRDYFGNSLGFEYYYRHPRNYNRRGIFSIDEPAPTMRGVNRPIPPGYLGHSGDPVPVSAELRALSTKERSLIQTFPEDFVWIGSKTAIEQMIGNAVPVKLANFISAIIKDFQIQEWNLVEQENLVANF